MLLIAFPVHDPNNIELKHLCKITPFLKDHFDKAVIRFTNETREYNKKAVAQFESDPYFSVTYCEKDSPIGEHFVDLYKEVCRIADPHSYVHLCTPDRLAFAVENYSDALYKDISISCEEHPVLFIRSQFAWGTHPKTYYALESLLTREGEILFGKKLDFAWCHLVLKASDLKDVVGHLSPQDYTFMAEMIMFFKDKLVQKEVDWLSWEDPYILGLDAPSLRLEREQSPLETEKRLSYVEPILRYLLLYYAKQCKIA